jgi:hypothetical protein
VVLNLGCSLELPGRALQSLCLGPIPKESGLIGLGVLPGYWEHCLGIGSLKNSGNFNVPSENHWSRKNLDHPKCNLPYVAFFMPPNGCEFWFLEIHIALHLCPWYFVYFHWWSHYSWPIYKLVLLPLWDWELLVGRNNAWTLFVPLQCFAFSRSLVNIFDLSFTSGCSP